MEKEKNKKQIIFKKVLTVVYFILLALITVGLCLKKFSDYMTGKPSGLWAIFVVAAIDVVLILEWFLAEKVEAWLRSHTPLNKAVNIILTTAYFPCLFILTQLIAYKPLRMTDYKYFFWNILLLVLAFIFLLALTNRPSIAAVVVGILLTLIALACFYLEEFRGNPLMITDFTSIKTAAGVASEYKLFIIYSIALFLQCELFMFVAIGNFVTWRFPKKTAAYVIRAALAVLSAVTFYCFSAANLNESYFSKLDTWRLSKTYSEKGLLTSFLAQIPTIHVKAPEGYSNDTVQAIEEELMAETIKDNGLTGDAAEESVVTPENIIVIMNESFFDPAPLGEPDTDTELLPFWRSLDNVSGGLLYVPVRGSGTCNTEFEALTSNSYSFLNNQIIAFTMYCSDPVYGMADVLKSQGYSTLGVHPLAASNWNRENVYPWMHFDEFETLENWGGENHYNIRKWMSDESCYDRLIEHYAEKEDGEKLFTFCVTIQNHGGYDESTWKNGFTPSIHFNYEEDMPRAETFFTLINESDRALEKLITYFEDVDEPTMIVMFGDHQPWIEEDFYRNILDATRAEGKPIDPPYEEYYYFTQYMIWTNYEQEAIRKDISTNYLGALIMDKAKVKMSPYERFVLDMMEDYPVLGLEQACDAEGNWMPYDELPEEGKEAVEKYHYLEYNNIFDHDSKVRTSLFTLPDE